MKIRKKAAYRTTLLLLTGILLCVTVTVILVVWPTQLLPPVTLNVKDAGAKGDGVSDDTDVFMKVLQKAAASRRGAKVVVPAGSYLIRAKEPLPLHSNVYLKGSGNPILKFGASRQSDYGYEAFMITGRNIRMDGIVIDGNIRLIRGIGIHTGSSGVRITNSVIRSLSQPDNPQSPHYSAVVSGIMIYGRTSDITIGSCTITAISAIHNPPVARGIMIWSEPGQAIARSVRITGNVISHITPREDADGIYFDKTPPNSPPSNSVIERNIIHHTAKRGIKIAAPGVVIKDNHITNPYFGNNRYLFPNKDPIPQDMYSAISIYASQVSVSGNLIDGKGSYYAAIEVDLGPLSEIAIDNNIIHGGSAAPGMNTSGIRLGDVDQFSVTGNAISHVQTGIRLPDVPKRLQKPLEGKIADNVIRDVEVEVQINPNLKSDS